jgi:hypothetical protein
MSRTTFFYQECPVCGRSLRVAVRYFGREMSCTHCHGEFLAGPQGSVPSQHASEPHSPRPAGAFGTGTHFGSHQLGEA